MPLQLSEKIKLWREFIALKRTAHKMIDQGGILLVARTMFDLNHEAKHRQYFRDSIYSHKTQFIKKLYELGHCTHLSIQTQEKSCWSCGGTGDDDIYGECQDCNGSGIYDSHQLYRFVFNIEDKAFIWHQPVRLVNWDVVLTDTTGSKYVEQAMEFDTLDNNQIKLDLTMVHEWLVQNGVNKKELSLTPGLKWIVLTTARHIRYNSFILRISYPVIKLWNRINFRIVNFVSNDKITIIDDLPF